MKMVGKKIEKGVEHWMLQSKKEIFVKLTIVYKRTGGMNAKSLDDDTPSSKKVQLLLYWLNFAKNRVSKPIPKNFSKRLKSRAKATVSMPITLSFIGDVNRVRVLMRGVLLHH